jgi:quercetin dioxygenase-like cupin family protein
MGSDDRLREHPAERLAGPFQKVVLADALAQLRDEPHAATAGHRQVALVRRGPVALILFWFQTDGFLKEHRTDGEVTIHVLAGQLEVTVDGEAVPLATGELLSLAPGLPHAVRAVAPSQMLLTICREVAAGA